MFTPEEIDELLREQAEIDELRREQARQLEVLKKHLPSLKVSSAAEPPKRTLKDILMDLRPDQRPQVLRIAKALDLAKKKRKHMH